MNMEPFEPKKNTKRVVGVFSKWTSDTFYKKYKIWHLLILIPENKMDMYRDISSLMLFRKKVIIIMNYNNDFKKSGIARAAIHDALMQRSGRGAHA